MKSIAWWFISLFSFIFTIFYLPFLVWIFLFPLFHLLKHLKKTAMLWSLPLLSLSIATIIFYWVRDYDFIVYASGSLLIASFLLLFFMGCWFLLHHRKLVENIMLIPSLWLALLALYSFSPLGSFWMNLAVLQPYTGPLMWAVTSYGVTFLILLTNVLFYHAIPISKKKKMQFLSLLIFIFLFIGIVQTYSLNATPTGNDLKVSLIQGNFDQPWKERVANTNEILRTYINLTKQAAKDNPDVIVWPEYAIPISLHKREDITKQLSTLANTTQASLVIGTLTILSQQPYKRYDTTMTFYPNGSTHTYHSYRPIPTEPFVEPHPELGFIHTKNAKAGITLCYEETQRDINKKLTDQGAQFIIAQVNNQHFSGTHGLRLASLFSRLNAAEHNIYVVRASNNGITQIINPYGKVIARLEPNTQGFLTHTIFT